MEIFKRVLKEIGISLVLILVIGAVIVFAFYNRIPFAKEIPESIHYSNIDKNEYSVRGDVENVTSDTQTFMSSAQELRYYELIKLVLPGKINPFSSIDVETDIPSERVNASYVPSTGTGGNNSSSTGSENNTGTSSGNGLQTGTPADDITVNPNVGDIDLDRLKPGESDA